MKVLNSEILTTIFKKGLERDIYKELLRFGISGRL